MNVPFVVPEDDTTPYPADFERVVAGIRDMGYALDVIEEGRAGGAIFDRIPFLVSFDAAGRPRESWACTRISWWTRSLACLTISCATSLPRAFRRVSRRCSTSRSRPPRPWGG